MSVPKQTVVGLAPVPPVLPRISGGTAVDLLTHRLPETRLDPRLVLVTDPDSERAAAYRVLRHHLLERAAAKQVIVVTSPSGGDGKTTTAANLALALAECGRARVLLADAHLRRPQLAHLFQLPAARCFVDQIEEHRRSPTEPWTFTELPAQWLHVAAVAPANTRTQLLDGPAFAQAIDQLRGFGYDHIVIDGPPVLGSADVNLIADAADAVVMTVRSQRSTARELRRAVEQVGTSKLAGTVLVES